MKLAQTKNKKEKVHLSMLVFKSTQSIFHLLEGEMHIAYFWTGELESGKGTR